MVDKFITYKEELKGFDQSIQNQILNECVSSWKRKNFKTSVLSRRDAEKHLLYRDLLAASKKHCKITKSVNERTLNVIQFHSEASIIRWLAFANTKESNFFLGDYDIFNLNLNTTDTEYKKLTFLNDTCLCFSYVENWLWAEHLAEIFIKNIDIMYDWNESHVFYHDQDIIRNLYKNKYKIFTENEITFENNLISDPDPIEGVVPENCKLLHISHFVHRGFKDSESARLKTINKYKSIYNPI
jgi:hypothetical protein